MERICVYPKDVSVITGKSERFGRSLIKQIKDKFDKQKHQYITVEDFCNYTGISVQLVKERLRN